MRRKFVEVQKTQPTVFVKENGMVIRKIIHAAVLRLIRDNGGEVDKSGHVSGLPANIVNDTILDESGKPIPFSEGIICRKNTGGVNCHFDQAGKVIRVIRVGDSVIVPGHVWPLSADAVPCRWGCTPDWNCPTNCANNSRAIAKSMSMTARSLALAQ